MASSTPLWRRYSEFSAQQHIDFNTKHAGKYPHWRNRTGYRRLVLAEGFFVTLSIAAAIVSFFSTWAVPMLLAGLGGTLICLYLVRIVTGAVGDSPDAALDEIQIQQRHQARSVAFGILIALMFIPYVLLMVFANFDPVNVQFINGTALLLITLVLLAACLPGMLTAWWMTDADSEDLDPAFIPEQQKPLQSNDFIDRRASQPTEKEK